MKNNNLKVEMVYVTPEIAKNYLRFNIHNRDVSKTNLAQLVSAMVNDKFLENGESMVFDKFGNLKQGQHRCLAIIKTGKSYTIPIVRGVDADVMATFDTGKNRSASDVLKLNGFKYSVGVSSFIASFDKYKDSRSKGRKFKGTSTTIKKSNQQVLDFCQYNYDWIVDIVKKSIIIKNQAKPAILTPTQIAVISYMLGGEKPNEEVYEFMRYLTGVKRIPETATSYIFTKLYNSHINKEPLNFYWILGMVIKAYNYYLDGNPSVKYFKFSVDMDLPIINKINK